MLHYTMDEARQDWTSAPRMYIWKHPTQADKEPEITYDEANRAEAIGHHHDYSIITGAMSLASSMIEINGVRYIRQYRDNRTPDKFYGDPAIVLWRVDDVKQALEYVDARHHERERTRQKMWKQVLGIKLTPANAEAEVDRRMQLWEERGTTTGILCGTLRRISDTPKALSDWALKSLDNDRVRATDSVRYDHNAFYVVAAEAQQYNGVFLATVRDVVDGRFTFPEEVEK